MATFDTPEPIVAWIEIPVGTVHLIADDRADTVVTVTPSDRSRKADVEVAERTRVELSNRRLLVKTPKPRGIVSHVGIGRSGSVEVTVELPEGSGLDVEGGMVDLRADGRLGDTRIRNGAGEVRLDRTGPAEVTSGAGAVSIEHVGGRADVTTTGELRLARVDGDAEVKNHSGRTWVGEVSGRLRVKSSNGDIVVDRAHGGVTGTTASGSIHVGEVTSGSVVVQTAAGGVEVGIPSGTAAWVDARTQFGRVRNALEPTPGPAESSSTVEVHARTSFGDITIHRA